MKLFLHTITQIRIINEPLEWSGTPEAFLALEPLYPGLPVGATMRYQTPDVQYYEDAAGRHIDMFNALPYCDGAYLITPGPEIPGIYDHVNLLNKGTNTHAQLDTHLADATRHFTQAQIDHINLLSKGTNTHAQIDTHLADATKHFTQAQIDHVNLLNKGTLSHSQIESTLTSHQALTGAGGHLPSGSAWSTPTLLGTWVNFGSGYQVCQYMLGVMGQVFIRGLVKSGADNSTIFVLPETPNCRPPSRLLFFMGTSRIDVSEAGNVILVGVCPSFLSLYLSFFV